MKAAVRWPCVPRDCVTTRRHRDTEMSPRKHLCPWCAALGTRTQPGAATGGVPTSPAWPRCPFPGLVGMQGCGSEEPSPAHPAGDRGRADSARGRVHPWSPLRALLCAGHPLPQGPGGESRSGWFPGHTGAMGEPRLRGREENLLPWAPSSTAALVSQGVPGVLVAAAGVRAQPSPGTGQRKPEKSGGTPAATLCFPR